MSAAVITAPIGRIEGSQASRLDDRLAVEEPLEIRLGGKSLSITMRTPGNDVELAVGFLFTEGLIRDISEIRSVSAPSDQCRNVVALELVTAHTKMRASSQRNFLMTSACGVCGKASLEDLRANRCPVLPVDAILLDPETIHGLPDSLRKVQSAFSTTGGLHAADLFSFEPGFGAARFSGHSLDPSVS